MKYIKTLITITGLSISTASLAIGSDRIADSNQVNPTGVKLSKDKQSIGVDFAGKQKGVKVNGNNVKVNKPTLKMNKPLSVSAPKTP